MRYYGMRRSIATLIARVSIADVRTQTWLWIRSSSYRVRILCSDWLVDTSEILDRGFNVDL
jgi:hypothetical protein